MPLAPNDALEPDLAVRLATDTSAARPLATFELVTGPTDQSPGERTPNSRRQFGSRKHD